MNESSALYTLVAGEGDGAMLGLAAGDTAGGAWELGYSAYTEQATVIAYHYIENRKLDRPSLIEAIRELDGSHGEEPVYRAESTHFRAWLDRAAVGNPVADAEASIDPGPRSVPLGVANRRDLGTLATAVVDLGLLFHSDALTVLIGGVVASAVAASCYAQSGRDLIEGVREAAEVIAEEIKGTAGIVNLEALDDALEDLRELGDLVGITDGDEALAAVGGVTQPWELTKAGLLLSAPKAERDHLPVEQAARIGGSALGAVVGAIVGARVGIRAWPWPFANDTWFAEIGRRVARGPYEIRDLPIPYAVEQHLMSGDAPGFR